MDALVAFIALVDLGEAEKACPGAQPKCFQGSCSQSSRINRLHDEARFEKLPLITMDGDKVLINYLNYRHVIRTT